jgi:hypothetical protein
MIVTRSTLGGTGIQSTALAFGGLTPATVTCTEAYAQGMQTCTFVGTVAPPPYTGV